MTYLTCFFGVFSVFELRGTFFFLTTGAASFREGVPLATNAAFTVGTISAPDLVVLRR